MSSFEIHNLEGNQIYVNNIRFHFAYLLDKNKNYFWEEKNFTMNHTYDWLKLDVIGYTEKKR